MMPTTSDAIETLREIEVRAAETTPTIFDWQIGDMLVVDNWRVLHGRGFESSVVSPDRRILRVAVQ